jgi:site-specific DNA recombinase
MKISSRHLTNLSTTARTSAKRALRFASYCRCSSDDQDYGDFTTIDAQEEHNQRFIREQIAANGGLGEAIGTYIDAGRTGTNLTRPSFKRMLRDAQDGKVDVVVVTNIDRLGRGEAYTVAEYLLREAKASVATVRATYADDSAGRTHKRIKILGDAMYVDTIREKTKDKQAALLANGWCLGGTKYGLMSERVPGMVDVPMPGGKVRPAPRIRVPHPDEAPNVVRAFEIMNDTDNMGDVQRYLRVAAPERNWDMDTVRRLLTNDAYVGVERFGELVNYTAFKAILTEHLWDAVQDKIAARATRGKSETIGERGGEGRDKGYQKEDRKDPFDYYLKGLVYCAHCGTRMTPSDHHGASRPVRYYECVRGHKAAHRADCPARRVNAETLHEVVLAEFQRLVAHPTRLDTLIRDAARALPSPKALQDELKRLQHNRREADRKLKNNILAIEAGGNRDVMRTALAERIADLQAQKESILAQIDTLTTRLREINGRRPDAAGVLDLLSRFGELWEYADADIRSRILANVVKKVEMADKQKGTLHLFLQSPLQHGGVSSPIECAGPAKTHPAPSRQMGPRAIEAAFRVAHSSEPTTPSVCEVPITVPPGGRKRRASTANKEVAGV